MSDNLRSRGGQDRTRIDVGERWELDYWSRELGVTHEVLKEAVAEAGTHVDDVRRYLANRGVPVV